MIGLSFSLLFGSALLINDERKALLYFTLPKEGGKNTRKTRNNNNQKTMSFLLALSAMILCLWILCCITGDRWYADDKTHSIQFSLPLVLAGTKCNRCHSCWLAQVRFVIFVIIYF